MKDEQVVPMRVFKATARWADFSCSGSDSRCSNEYLA